MSHDLPEPIPFPLACPLCSVAASGRVHMISRPKLVRGSRSGVFFMVGGDNCPHLESTRGGNRSETGRDLVETWNAWAEKKAAQVCTRRGLSPEATAYFCEALRSPRFY
jgi:hypothetical protein